MRRRPGPGELDEPSCSGLCWRSGFVEVGGHSRNFEVVDADGVHGRALHV
jgi:hypothetical protein